MQPIEELRRIKSSHARGVSLEFLAEPRPCIPSPSKSAHQRATVMPPVYNAHKQKDFTQLVRRVENVFIIDATIHLGMATGPDITRTGPGTCLGSHSHIRTGYLLCA